MCAGFLVSKRYLSAVLFMPLSCIFAGIMSKPKEDYSFWTKYKQFAGYEILLYVIMIVGIILGIVFFS
jgi:H+/gluconate symporter-like permease